MRFPIYVSLGAEEADFLWLHEREDENVRLPVLPDHCPPKAGADHF
jgi:hypothetical protein